MSPLLKRGHVRALQSVKRYPNPRDLSVRSDLEREWKIAALSVFCLLRSSSQPL